MSTRSWKQIEALLERFDKALAYESEEEEIEQKSYFLMLRFISEIFIHIEANQITQKMLAEKIKTSSSYLTQVFRTDKPLNFVTLAKIEKALGIEFRVKAYPITEASGALPVLKKMPSRKTNGRQPAKKKSSK